jgi:hypothetical protein
VALYRVYILEANGHSASPPEIIECETDEEAIQQAGQCIDGKAVEVWQDKKLVAKLSPQN